jgi:hypothetical protein
VKQPAVSSFVLSLGVLALTACGDPAITAPQINPRALRSLPRASVAHSGVVDVPIVEGHVIARFKPGSDAAGEAAAYGAAVSHEIGVDRTFVLDVAAGTEATVANALAGDASVEFAEPDFLMAIEPCGTGSCTTPNDPFFGYKWDLNNTGTLTNASGGQLAISGKVDADIDWLEMFNALGPDFAGSAIVGILDSGIRSTHQDFAGRVILQRNFATGYPAELVEDRDGHGTNVAGIAAARGNNGVGLSGVAYGANIKLINAKVCELYLFPDNSTRTSCPNSSTAEAIVWATDNGANVLNLSLGGSPTATVGPAAIQAALRYARSKSVLPFCASGNDNYPALAFPARFPECVAVGATNWSDKRTSYSNYGPGLALTAPGGDVESLPNGFSLILGPDSDSDNGYSWYAGTSQATPQATGLAAMLYASGMTDDDAVLERLKRTADDLGVGGYDDEYGAGRINAYRALTLRDPNDPPAALIHRQSSVAGRVGQTYYLFGQFTDNPGDGPWTYTFSWGDGTSSSGTLSSYPASNQLQYRSKVWTRAGTFRVRYTVVDKNGLTGFQEKTVTVAP